MSGNFTLMMMRPKYPLGVHGVSFEVQNLCLKLNRATGKDGSTWTHIFKLAKLHYVRLTCLGLKFIISDIKMHFSLIWKTLSKTWFAELSYLGDPCVTAVICKND